MRAEPAPNEPVEELADAVSRLYASGAVLVLGILVFLPAWEGRDDRLLWLVAVYSLATAATVRLRRSRTTTAHGMALVAVGSTIIGLAAVGSGTLAPSIALFYVWVSLVSFYFFPRRWAFLQSGFAAVTHAVSLAFTAESTSLAVAQWVFALGTSLMAGVVVGALVRRIGRTAMEDWLTGALNRRAWELALRTALAQVGRNANPATLLLIDVDNFKELNDRLGHAAGDEALRGVARAWTDRLRAADIVARLGGDEFGVLLVGCDAANASAVADTVRGELPDGLTCSIGIAPWNGEEECDELMARADRALYEAKEQGRDRIVVATPSAVEIPTRRR